MFGLRDFFKKLTRKLKKYSNANDENVRKLPNSCDIIFEMPFELKSMINSKTSINCVNKKEKSFVISLNI